MHRPSNSQAASRLTDWNAIMTNRAYRPDQNTIQQTAAASRHPARFGRLIAFGAALLGLSIPAIALAGDDDRHRVAISYLLAPAKPLPEDVRAVAVIDSRIESDEERRDSRERKWQSMAADMIESMIQSGSNEANGDPALQALKVVDRRATRQILAEKDMQLVGIVEGDAAAAAGKLLAVDGLIMSRIKISIDYRRTRKEKIDWVGILGGGRGGPPSGYRGSYHRGPNNPYRRRPPSPRGGPDIPKQTIEEISRDLTIHCSFTLVDARTGEAIVRFTPPVIQKRDKAKPQFLFGGRVDPADLDPVDHFIGELVEQAAREFVSRISPVRATYIYPLEISGKEGEPAIRALRADDYRGAADILSRAYEKKQKETDYLFGLGLIHEMVGRPQEALDIYRQLVSHPKVKDKKLDVYMAAKDRLSADIDRIIPGREGELNGGLVTGNGNSKDDRKRRGKDRDEDDDDDDDDDD